MIDHAKLSDYKENNRIEAKKATGGLPQSLWPTYSAFANTDGGVILLGVAENADGTLNAAGLVNPEKLVSEIWNNLNNHNKVNINILTNNDVQITDVDGRRIIMITVPRATRLERPVYINNNHNDTFRRNGEGDYRCTEEEVWAMLRDKAVKTQDMLVLENMDSSVFNYETVAAYRNRLKITRPDHVWENLADNEFLYKLGAIGLGDDREKHPTAAGLLMFG